MVRTTRKRISKTVKKYSTRRLELKGNLYRKRKRKISISKLLKLSFWSVSFIAVFFVVLYGVFLYDRTNAESVNQEVVLKQLSTIITLPDSSNLISIKRISNAKELISQNKFYKDINLENGDYIIVYNNTLIIYNFDQNHIKKIENNNKNEFLQKN